MPVGNVDYSGGLGQGPGVGDLAQLAARLFTRGGGGGQPTAPVTGEMLQGAFGIPAAAAPTRNYLGGDVASAQQLIKSMVPQPPPPERGPMPQLAGGPPVPMSKPQLGPQQAGYIGGGKITGPGDGRSDSVPAMVDGQGMAQLSTDEYVVPADVVSALGRGSSAAGAKKLDAAIQQVRSGYAGKLKGMPKPKASSGKKFLGGLFQTEQESDIEMPDYLKDVAGSIPGRIRSYEKARPSAVSEVAKFTPDQLAFFQRSRQAAGDVTGAQGAYQRGQDLLGGIYQGGDPWSDQLIQASMADYDRGTAIDAAGRRRSAAGRGAFGEGTQLAEVEAGREAARGRGLLGEQLREQGLSRRTQAAQQIGSLAGLERQANIGDLGLLGGIGEIQYGRAQKVAEAPWQKVARINSLLQGAPISTTQTTTESPLKMMIGAAATVASGAAAGAKDGGRVRAGGRASHRKRADDPVYADGGKVGPGAFKRIPVSKPDDEERVRAAVGMGDPKYQPSPASDAAELKDMLKPLAPRTRQPEISMADLPAPSGRSYADRFLGAGQRRSANVNTEQPKLKALFSDLTDSLMAEGRSQEEADRVLDSLLEGIKAGQYRTGIERLNPVMQGLEGARMHGRPDDFFKRRGYADGGSVGPEAFFRGIDQRNQAFNELQARREAAQGPGLGDWFQRYVMSGNDPAWMQELRGDPQMLPPPPERTGGNSDSIADRMKKRVAELVGPAVPDAVPAGPAPGAPIPVSKPARKGGAKKAGPTTVATAAPLLAAPGMGALPARLRSPEEPITAAPPSPPASGIKVTELPPPPPADAPAKEKQSWFDRWSSNPLTQFGLAMMASPTGQSVGQAIGSAGLTAIAGAAAGRKESREEQRLALADQRAQAKEDRDEKADVRAMMKIGLDEEQAKEVAANNREQRRQADVRLQLEQDRVATDAAYKQSRLGQLNEGLNIRRQALAKTGTGKAAADPNKVQRAVYQKAIAEADLAGDTESATEARKLLAALGPVPAGGAFDQPPEGFAIDDEEE